MQYIIPCHDCMSALGNKEQPVPWDAVTDIFALSESFFYKTQKIKRVSLFSLNCSCELQWSISLCFPAITLMSNILIYFIYFTTLVLINYFIWSV